MENREELQAVIEAAVENGIEKGLDKALKKRRKKHLARVLLLGAALGCGVVVYLNYDKIEEFVTDKAGNLMREIEKLKK